MFNWLKKSGYNTKKKNEFDKNFYASEEKLT